MSRSVETSCRMICIGKSGARSSGPTGCAGARVEHGRRGRRKVGRDVVPGLRKPALVEDELHLVGHLALLSLGRTGALSLADPGPTGKR